MNQNGEKCSPDLTQRVDFTNAEQMAQDAWLFLTNDEMPNKYKISKKAFLHEVGCMLELMKGHYETRIAALKEYNELLTDELSDMAGSAFAHGWRSTRVEQGEAFREKIRLLEEVTHVSPHSQNQPPL
jgi:hypothetical protein